MNSTISAIYQHGVFRPLEQLTLPESTRVQIQLLLPKQHNTFQRRLMNLYALLLDRAENGVINNDAQLFPQILQSDLKMLWYLCNPAQRDFCAMLELAALHLDGEQLTAEQIAAFQFGLECLEQEQVTKNDFDHCYEMLVAAGLPPSFSFDFESQSQIDQRPTTR